VIAAQPSHPWVARASNVFTKEFFELVRSRLNEGGIYGQWVNLFNMDATTLRAIFKAFFTVFPHGMSFANLDTGDFLLFGANHKLIYDYDQVTQRMDKPEIKSVLAHHEIYGAQDLFWYFALTREEALKAAGEIEPNTDTNIFSEVRLSQIDDTAKGEENPYDFLNKHYGLTITPYLQGDVAQKLNDFARYLFSWDEERMARLIAKQLEEIDPVLGRGVRYELKWRAGNYKEAVDYYDKYEQWPDRTHYLHALALAEDEKFQRASVSAEKIQDEALRRRTYARLMFEEQKWRQLAGLQPQSDEERQWQLVALARTDLRSAGRQLEHVKDKVELELPQLKLLVKYYSLTGDENSLTKYARLLVEKVDSETKRLAKLTNMAIAAKSSQRAKILLDKMVAVNPQAENITKLKQRIAELGQPSASQS
jgi:hypothetical protein